MKRRKFIALLGGAAVAWPLTARAQSAAMPVIGVLTPNSPIATGIFPAPFAQGLKDAGYIESQNVAVAYRCPDGRNDFPALAADLVRQHVAVIMAGGTAAALAAKAATTTIPIVFQLGTDPVKEGLVASLNRPGGNVTGVTNTTVGLATKRLGLLHELAPQAATIAVLGDPTSGTFEPQMTELQDAASPLGLQLIFLKASSASEIDAAFTTLVQQRAGALLITDTPFFNGRRELRGSDDLHLSSVRGGRRSDKLCFRPYGRHSPSRRLCRPNSQRRETGRPACATTDEVRVGHQSKNRQDAWSHGAVDHANDCR